MPITSFGVTSKKSQTQNNLWHEITIHVKKHRDLKYLKDLLAISREVKQEKYFNGKLVDFWTQCPHPQHNDEHPSLHVSLGKDGKILIHCFVCAAMGTPKDEVLIYFKALFSQQKINNHKDKINEDGKKANDCEE